ncbi:MAG: hypothetical protein ACI8PP_002774 [Candidatus Pseudothioglobus sp.]|jgi:hypothetical protein
MQHKVATPAKIRTEIMLRYLVFGIIVTAVLIGTKLWLATASLVPAETESASAKPAGTPANASRATKPVAADAVPLLSSAVPDKSSAAVAQADNNFIDPAIADLAWSDGDPTLTPPEQYQRKGIVARAMRLNLKKIAGLRAGDDITVSIPQTGQNYTMDIDSITTHKNGDRRVTGSLQNETSPYNMVLTEGKTSTFATIITPDGAYMLEALGASGWITSLADLNYLSAPNQTDARIPNITP